MNLISFNEFENENMIKVVSNPVDKYIETNIICPKCEDGIMMFNSGIVLTSYPPQYEYRCNKCGHVKYSFKKYNEDIMAQY